MLGMGCRPMFVEVLMLVTYRIILVAKNKILYTNVSNNRRPIPLFSPSTVIQDTFSTTSSVMTKWLSKPINALSTLINKILKTPGINRQRNRKFGKSRRKQSKIYSYKLRVQVIRTGVPWKTDGHAPKMRELLAPKMRELRTWKSRKA